MKAGFIFDLPSSSAQRADISLFLLLFDVCLSDMKVASVQSEFMERYIIFMERLLIRPKKLQVLQSKSLTNLVHRDVSVMNPLIEFTALRLDAEG